MYFVTAPFRIARNSIRQRDVRFILSNYGFRCLAKCITFIMNLTENRDPLAEYLVRERRLIEIVLKNGAVEFNETILIN